MNDQARLLDGPFSEGLDTVTKLVRCKEFSPELGELIRQKDGAERAVLAMNREFFPVGTVDGRPAPRNHYLVRCHYAAYSHKEDLQKFRGGVSDIFDTKKWQKHALVMSENEVPGNRHIWLADPPKELLDDSEAIIAWGYSYRTGFAPKGYRPIMAHHELLDLHRAFPELCTEYSMVALGSFELAYGSLARRVVALDADRDGKPLLDDEQFDGGWSAIATNTKLRFPLVRL